MLAQWREERGRRDVGALEEERGRSTSRGPKASPQYQHHWQETDTVSTTSSALPFATTKFRDPPPHILAASSSTELQCTTRVPPASSSSRISPPPPQKLSTSRPQHSTHPPPPQPSLGAPHSDSTISPLASTRLSRILHLTAKYYAPYLSTTPVPLSWSRSQHTRQIDFLRDCEPDLGLWAKNPAFFALATLHRVTALVQGLAPVKEAMGRLGSKGTEELVQTRWPGWRGMRRAGGFVWGLGEQISSSEVRWVLEEAELPKLGIGQSLFLAAPRGRLMGRSQERSMVTCPATSLASGSPGTNCATSCARNEGRVLAPCGSSISWISSTGRTRSRGCDATSFSRSRGGRQEEVLCGRRSGVRGAVAGAREEERTGLTERSLSLEVHQCISTQTSPTQYREPATSPSLLPKRRTPDPFKPPSPPRPSSSHKAHPS